MRSFFFPVIFLFVALSLTACNVSVTPGGIEDRHKPKVDENLAPLPKEILDFSVETTKLFFAGGRNAIEGRLHPIMSDVKKSQWTALENFASDNADFDALEYYGHGFEEQQGLSLVVVQLKVPFENGYNLVKLVMTTDEECCHIAGFHVTAEKIKSFKLGK